MLHLGALNEIFKTIERNEFPIMKGGLTSKFYIEYSTEQNALLFVNPDQKVRNGVIIKIRLETLNGMSFSEAAAFIGDRVLLTVPEMRRLYKKHLIDMGIVDDEN